METLAHNTHEVFNQTPVLADFNLYASNLALREAVARGRAQGYSFLDSVVTPGL